MNVKRRATKMEHLLEVDVSWLTNLTRGERDVCWEELYSPIQDGYTETFNYADVVYMLDEKNIEYDKVHLELFKKEIIRVSGNIETRLILDIQ